MALSLRLVPEKLQHKTNMPPLIRAAALLYREVSILQITIGHTSDDKRALKKSFSGQNIAVTLKQPCSILNPVFELKYYANYITCNYLYAPDLGRYYFIDNITLRTGGICEVSCSVDVLMSYQHQIASITCVIARQQESELSLVPDSNIVLQNFNNIDVYNFPQTFDVSIGSYVLQVIGGHT